MDGGEINVPNCMRLNEDSVHTGTLGFDSSWYIYTADNKDAYVNFVGISDDIKVTDMLYGCYALADEGKNFDEELNAIKDRYNEIIDGLKLDLNDERRRGRLIQILHRAQHIFGYLPREVQQHVAAKMRIPESAVSGVVSFYNYFTTKPKGKYVVNVCLGTACYVKGSETVLREIERYLGVQADTNPTADGLFSISALRCVGACGLAPVMMVNDKVYGKVTPAKAVEIIKEYQAKG